MKGELSSVGEGASGKEVKLEFMPLDLASLSSVKQFTVAFLERNLPLHILINNAGIAWLPLGKLPDSLCTILRSKFNVPFSRKDGGWV